ncbi:MAG TPA: hypothetical protein PK147_10310 [Saprospiraceae bacterium]|nr:hypothetical protein [Saprospiraceae bacterium]
MLAILSLYGCQKLFPPPKECEINLHPKDAYDYPIVPGTPEWIALSSGDEMFAVTQVPVKEAKKMSTDGLIQTWMTYPLNGDIGATNDWPRTMEYFKKRFNPLHELITRRDAGCKLLERYKLFDIREFNGPGDLLAIVALSCDFNVLDKMRDDQRYSLIREGLTKHYVMFEYPKLYSLATMEFNLWVCARVMKYLKYQPFLDDIGKSEDLWLFVETGHMQVYLTYDSFEVQSVIRRASELINY